MAVGGRRRGEREMIEEKREERDGLTCGPRRHVVATSAKPALQKRQMPKSDRFQEFSQ
jgi:hypothetical protein